MRTISIKGPHTAVTLDISSPAPTVSSLPPGNHLHGEMCDLNGSAVVARQAKMMSGGEAPL